MNPFPSDILKAATTTVSKISSLMEDAPTLGAAATEVIAEALMARDEHSAEAIRALRRSLQRMLLEFDFMVEDGSLPDIRNDIIFVNARSALAIRSGEHP